MKKPPLFLMLFLAVLLVVGSSHTPTNSIYWEPGKKLTWDDFQGEPNYDHDDISALTSSGIVHYRGCENGKIIFKVKAYFEKKNSWVKEEAHTDYHLGHEQLHFDITELYARKLRTALERRSFNCDEEGQFDRFVREYLQGWQSAQIKYDMGTHYSLKHDKQKDWHYLVAMELSMYDHHLAN